MTPTFWEPQLVAGLWADSGETLISSSATERMRPCPGSFVPRTLHRGLARAPRHSAEASMRTERMFKQREGEMPHGLEK